MTNKFTPLNSIQDITPAIFAFATNSEFNKLPEFAKNNFAEALRAMDADMAHEGYLTLYGARANLGPAGWLLCAQLAKYTSDHLLMAEGKPVGMLDGTGHAQAVYQVALRNIGDQTGPDASTDPHDPDPKWGPPEAKPVIDPAVKA